MRNKQPSARAAAKEATHERIVSVAARAIRRNGYHGTGVADIMKEAGLTHGGFYAHFGIPRGHAGRSGQCRACTQSVATVAGAVAGEPASQAMATVLKAYLSRQHVESVETGCPLAALGSETSRQSPEVRSVSTRHIKEMVDLIARQSPQWGQPETHEQALVTLSTMVGALVLARAVDDVALSDSLREAALKHLLPAEAA